MRRPSLHERCWGAEEHDFAAAWRSQPKWVVSRTLKSVGPNATLVEDDIEAVIRGLKAQPVGEIEVAGPDLAGSLQILNVLGCIALTGSVCCSCIAPCAAADAPTPAMPTTIATCIAELPALSLDGGTRAIALPMPASIPREGTDPKLSD